jgi:uncharacterized protein (TIGR02246 family)
LLSTRIPFSSGQAQEFITMQAHPRWKKALFIATMLAASGGGGYVANRTTSQAVGQQRIGHVPARQDAGTADEEKAIQKVRLAYLKAFNAGDAKALAGFWAEDGEFVDAEGRSFRGRGAIAREFAAFFAESKGLTLDVTMDSLRFVAPGVALETGSSHVTRVSDGVSSSAAYNMVLTRKDGQWQFASVREIPSKQSSNYDRLRDLEWLVGDWMAKNGGRTLEMNCEWAENRNFLFRRYSLKETDGASRTGLQVIGWDPVLGAVRSWAFDSDGGFGSEQWSRDGQRWVLEATAVRRDGAQTAATNILTPLDHDSFTWQSVRRTANEARLPDTAVVKVTRVKAKPVAPVKETP